MFYNLLVKTVLLRRHDGKIYTERILNVCKHVVRLNPSLRHPEPVINARPPASGIMRDEELFPQPNLFLPERFLPNTPHTSTHPRINLKEFDLPFGFGRRICPGMHLGLNSLYITISRILWAFDIRPVKDELGRDVIPGVFPCFVWI